MLAGLLPYPAAKLLDQEQKTKTKRLIQGCRNGLLGRKGAWPDWSHDYKKNNETPIVH